MNDLAIKVNDNDADVDAYVEEFATTVEGDTVNDVVERMDEVHRALMETIDADLEAKVAVSKTGLVTTSEELARRLRARLGVLAGPRRETFANLGNNVGGGRKRTRKSGRRGGGEWQCRQ